MRVPFSLTASMAGYLARKSITGAQKFPLVMMLEPLHACNLTCTGCGRIREYKSTINEMLTVEECLKAVDDCGAPIVSICGGEPMIYPGDWPADQRNSRAQEAHLSLHQRNVYSQAPERIHAYLASLFQRSPRRTRKDA